VHVYLGKSQGVVDRDGVTHSALRFVWGHYDYIAKLFHYGYQCGNSWGGDAIVVTNEYQGF
jgi:hypothetical protein